MHLLSSIEARASGSNKRPFVHRIKMFVPPFDQNYVMWPSYVEKLYLHYADELLQRQQRLRAEAARARDAARAARGGDDDDEEDFTMTLFGGRPGGGGLGAGLRVGARNEWLVW
jgi:hypothetical protein